MLIDNIKEEAVEMEVKKKKADKLQFDFKEGFVVDIKTGDKNGSIQNT